MLIYKDNLQSPEERRSKMPKYQKTMKLSIEEQLQKHGINPYLRCLDVCPALFAKRELKLMRTFVGAQSLASLASPSSWSDGCSLHSSFEGS